MKKELGVVGARQGTPRKATSAPLRSSLVSASGVPKSVGKLPYTRRVHLHDGFEGLPMPRLLFHIENAPFLALPITCRAYDPTESSSRANLGLLVSGVICSKLRLLTPRHADIGGPDTPRGAIPGLITIA